MPATEETWRDQYKLHIVFAVSSALMFVSIVAMMAEDHLREWKATQREFRRLDAARTAQEAEETRAQLSERTAQLEAAVAQSERDVAAQEETVSEIRSRLTNLEGQEQSRRMAWLFARANRDEIRSKYDLAVRDGAPQPELYELQAKVDAADERVDERRSELEKVEDALEAAQAELAAITRPRDDARKELENHLRELSTLERALEQKRPSFAKWIMEQPVLDAFNAPLQINQIWLPDLTINYGGFKDVARFDRCTTCHLAIDRSASGGGPAFPADEYEQPFVTHPRLDLFVGATSAHPMGSFGCTVCHDGQGSATSFTLASHTPNTPVQLEQWQEEYGWYANHYWDLPQLPGRFIESTCIKCHHNVVDLEAHPRFGDTAPKVVKGFHLVREYGCFGCHEINGFRGDRQIGPDLRLEPSDPEQAARIPAVPNAETGIMRKVGPSLRHLASKVTAEWAYHWIREPKAFYPDTRMPQFFGLSNQQDDLAARFMPLEIRGVVEYLMASSEPFQYEQAPGDVAPDPGRGKQLFLEKGCLACHTHDAFPEATNRFGPNLSKIAAKLKDGQEGVDWLYSWLKEPKQYHPRTRMPNLLLEQATDADGTTYDPAADIAAWLLSYGERPEFDVPELDDGALADLDAMLLDDLKKSMTISAAQRVLEEGMPEESARGDQVELVRPITTEKKLAYLGRRTVSRYGCFGCHDIPGYEQAKPIGTQLTDWGRKQTKFLAFEHIIEKLEHEEHAEQRAEEDPGYYGFYWNELESGSRTGFLWQKLREPRSYDYQKTSIKAYDERLRMPQFPLDGEEIEAIVTFVLSLVADPPAEQHVYRPQGAALARIEGHRMIQRYNCAACHVLEMPGYTFQAGPDDYPEPSRQGEFDFLIEALRQRAGKPGNLVEGERPASVHGLVFDRDEDFGELYVDVWEPTHIGENLWLPGDRITISTEKLQQQTAGLGGEFARLLVDAQLREEPDVHRAWQRVPPPLVDEGRKAQSGWLFRFLLDPHEIRPITLLRMPRFNISEAEAHALADYFGAAHGAEYPYQDVPQTTSRYLEEQERQHPEYLEHAWRMLTNRDACLACHAVAGRTPSGDPNDPEVIFGPNLGPVEERLQPDWTLLWLASPKRTTPYTSMPQNFKRGQPDPIFSELFPGTPAEQVRALRDVMMNYDTVFERQLARPEPAVSAAPAEGGETR